MVSTSPRNVNDCALVFCLFLLRCLGAYYWLCTQGPLLTELGESFWVPVIDLGGLCSKQVPCPLYYPLWPLTVLCCCPFSSLHYEVSSLQIPVSGPVAQIAETLLRLAGPSQKTDSHLYIISTPYMIPFHSGCSFLSTSWVTLCLPKPGPVGPDPFTLMDSFKYFQRIYIVPRIPFCFLYQDSDHN